MNFMFMGPCIVLVGQLLTLIHDARTHEQKIHPSAVCPFWFRKITTDPHILSHVNMECLDDWYPKLKFTSQLISDRHSRIPVATAAMHCIYLTLITDRHSLCG